MQSWINAQRRYCADPRLDRTREASLKHQRKHGAARKKLRSTLWNIFSLFFCSFFALFSMKNHYNGECLKILLKPRKQDRHEIFSGIFFGCPDQKSGFRARKVAMMGSVSKHVSRPKNTRGEKKFTPEIFGLESALESVPDFFFWKSPPFCGRKKIGEIRL